MVTGKGKKRKKGKRKTNNKKNGRPEPTTDQWICGVKQLLRARSKEKK